MIFSRRPNTSRHLRYSVGSGRRLAPKMHPPQTNQELMLKLSQAKMPFGKYAGTRLIHLPEPYVVWFSRNGFPDGELGKMLAIVHEIKVNGLEYLFDPLK